MKNDEGEFEERVYRFALDVIAFVEQLPKGQFPRLAGERGAINSACAVLTFYI